MEDGRVVQLLDGSGNDPFVDSMAPDGLDNAAVAG